MKREEAIIRFEKQLKAAQVVLDSGFGSNPGESDRLYRERKEMAEIALAALRALTREQVEKMRGEWVNWEDGVCCSICETERPTKSGAIKFSSRLMRFCPYCGSPMTDEAVDMVMEKLKKVIE